MITDSLANAGHYVSLHPRFAAAFAFLHDHDLSRLPVRRHTIQGDALFAVVSEGDGRGHGTARLEAHRNYIDIHYTVSGIDDIGWRPLDECSPKEEDFNREKDIGFLSDDPEEWLKVPAGHFAVFFPEDAHAPLAGSGRVRKVVIKVAV